MNRPNTMLKLIPGLVAGALLCLTGATAWGQVTSSTTVRHGQSSYDTTVKNANVVYVSGNNLVLKFDDGRVEHFVVPNSDKFTVDGKDVTVHELQPGTKLTQTLTTKTTPRYVNTIETIEGTVWKVYPPNRLILRLPDGSKQFTFPSGTKFNVGGQEKTAFDLRKGMKTTVTIVTDQAESVIEYAKATTGEAPKPAIPSQVGVLLFTSPRRAPATAPTEMASAEMPKKLPKTGSTLPLLGLLGLLSVGASLGLRILRQ